MYRISTVIVPALRYAIDFMRFVNEVLQLIGWEKRSFSHKGQDRWVIEEIFPARPNGGYFVEIGGGDGRTSSNTYILERNYAWSGVIIEANPFYTATIKRVRRCHCVTACVDGTVGNVEFLPFGYLGGIVSEDTDHSKTMRAQFIRKHNANIMHMKTKTLDTILQEVGAPNIIDYLSIDVEGAEFRILSTFPFEKYQFLTITVERPSLQLHQILIDAGYILVKIFRFDGFYVSSSIAKTRFIAPCDFKGIKSKFF